MNFLLWPSWDLLAAQLMVCADGCRGLRVAVRLGQLYSLRWSDFTCSCCFFNLVYQFWGRCNKFTVIVDLFISPFSCISLCFLSWSCVIGSIQFQDTYILLNWPFFLWNVSVYLWNASVLKMVLSDTVWLTQLCFGFIFTQTSFLSFLLWSFYAFILMVYLR